MTHIENCQETLKTLGKDLFVKGFDLHSVWNQISVFNKDFAAALAKGQEQLAQDEEYESDHSEIIQDDLESVSERLSGDASEEIGDLSGSDYSEIDQDMDEDDTFEQDPQKTKRKRTEVDDDFFSVRAMEEFAEMGERQDIKMSKMQAPESDAEESDNDIFSFGKGLANGEFDEEDNANDVRYEDFFGTDEVSERPRRKNWNDDMPTAIEDEANETPVQEKAKVTELFYDAPVVNDNLSTYEKQQAKMKATIKTLEEENIGEKKWTLKGEASSKIRPLNSLLEEDLEFEQTSKPIPVITEETTATLDDMIIQRIKDQAWDDVVKAAPIKNSVFDPNRRFELQDEKSSKTLGEIYEEDYMKKAKPGEYTTEKDAALEKQHTEIDLIFTNLCNSLDALSNFHYTPKAATMEVTVMPAPSVPAISMEDVTPANVSAAMIAAPNEVYSAKAGKSQAEMDRVDKKNARVKAKRNALKDRKARELAKAMAEKNTTTQAAMTQQGAIKKLMSQSNVTMIAANGKEKKSFGKGAARVIEKGGKLTKEKAVHMPEMLKL